MTKCWLEIYVKSAIIYVWFNYIMSSFVVVLIDH